jgi:hypothetical protein
MRARKRGVEGMKVRSSRPSKRPCSFNSRIGGNRNADYRRLEDRPRATARQYSRHTTLHKKGVMGERRSLAAPVIGI